MWLAEVLSGMRGEEVQLRNDPATLWCCDPHTRVWYMIKLSVSCYLSILGTVPT